MSILPQKSGEYTLQLRTSDSPILEREYTGYFAKESGHWYYPALDHHVSGNIGYLDRITPIDEDIHGLPKEAPGARDYKIVGVTAPIFRYRDPVETYYTDRFGNELAAEYVGSLDPKQKELLLSVMYGDLTFIVAQEGSVGIMAEMEFELGDDGLRGDLKQQLEASVRDYRRRFAEDYPEVDIYATAGPHIYEGNYALRAFAPLCVKMRSSSDYRNSLRNDLFRTIRDT